MDQGALIAQIDLDASSMKPYEGFIFLCGGEITDINQPVRSVRDGLFREMEAMSDLQPRIKVAESFKDWNYDSHYRDLVEFERHLAELSSVIVLILESAGSIAELGLFAAINEFHHKLMVVVETTYYHHESFIRRGLVDYLEKSKKLETECFDWRSGGQGGLAFDPVVASETIKELAESVKERAAIGPSERRFARGNWLDRALLLCDLLGLYHAMTFTELVKAFETTKCQVPDEELRQMLFILEKVGFIKMEKRSSQRFYVGLTDRQFLRLRFKDGSIDANRIRMLRLEHYRQTDRRRFGAIRTARRGL